MSFSRRETCALTYVVSDVPDSADVKVLFPYDTVAKFTVWFSIKAFLLSNKLAKGSLLASFPVNIGATAAATRKMATRT